MFWGAPRSTQTPTRSSSLGRVITPPDPSLDGSRLHSRSVPANSGAEIRAQMPRRNLQQGPIPEDMVADAAHAWAPGAHAPGESQQLSSSSAGKGTAEPGANGEPGVVRDGQAASLEQGDVPRQEQGTATRPAASNVPSRSKRPRPSELPLGDAAGRFATADPQKLRAEAGAQPMLVSVPVPPRPSGGNAPGGSLAEQPGPISPQALSSALKAPAPVMPQRPSQRGDSAGAPGAPPAKQAQLPAGSTKDTLRQKYCKDEEKGMHGAASLLSSTSGSSSGHYDPTGAVVMRIEYLCEMDLKWTIAFIHCAELVGLAVLILVLLAKLYKPDNYFIADNTLVLVNACTGIIMWLVLLEFFLIYVHHICRANRHRRLWSIRRYKGTVVLFIEASAQILNLSFFVIPNVYVLVRPCGWRDDIVLWSAFVSWTCWNTLFLLSVVRAHNLNLWLDKEGTPKGERSDATVVDAPWWVHAPKLILWAGAEAFKATSVYLVLQRKQLVAPYMPPGTEGGDCRQWLYDCRHDTTTVILISLESAVFLVYFGLFFFYLARAFHQLRGRNYRDFRMANLSVRLIVRTRVAGVMFFVACVVIYYYVHLGSCLSYVAAALGLLPMHFVMTALIIVMLYLFMPKDPDAQDQVLQVWLQEFAWTEAEKLRRLKERSSNLRLTSIVREEVDREPMFCFETAIKLYYFSHIIYFYDKLEGVQSATAGKPRDEVTHIGVMRRKLSASLSKLRPGGNLARVVKPTANNLAAAAAAAQADSAEGGDGLGEESVHAGEQLPDSSSGRPPFARGSTGPESTSGSSEGGTNHRGRRGRVTAEDFSLECAMGLYGLEHMEVMWERRHDTMALLGWGPGRIVIVFRGTNSLKNVVADLQAWQVPHPPARGSHFCGGRPAVHQGFLKSWVANGLNQRIIARVEDIVTSHEWACTKVYVTGHSLGGSLANLAAYDIARALEHCPRMTRIICYTFGSPRTGNHAFARDYQRVVPDTWSIINDQDAVARNAKFWVLYKRPGQRVLINVRGDMLVRPSFAELSIQQTPVGSSVYHHYLLSYRDALAAICRAQMNRKKRLQGGLAGVMALLEGDEFVRGILEPAGLALSDVRESQTASLRRLKIKPPAEVAPSATPEGAPGDEARASVLAPPRSAFEKSAAARAAAIQVSELSARDEADAMEAGEAGAAALPASNSLLSVSSTESWKTALSTARPSGDLDTSLAGVPPSMLGMRRDSTGSQSSTKPDGTSPDRSSRTGDLGVYGGESGVGSPLVEAGQQRTASGQGASASGQAELAEGMPHVEQNGRSYGWPEPGAAQKGVGARPLASFEKENAQPNGIASAAAFLRTAPGPGDAWPVSLDTWEDAPAGEKQGSFPGFWRMGDPGTQSIDGASDGAPIAPPLSDAGYGGGARGKNRPGQLANGAVAAAAAAGTIAAGAAIGHGRLGQPESGAAVQDRSKGHGQEASELLVNGAVVRRDEGGLAVREGSVHGAGSAIEGPASQHDLRVATGFTGAPGQLQRRQDQSPSDAISSFLAAQRAGGTINPQVRIAAAYALANGAVTAKQKMAERSAARAAEAQADAVTQEGAAEGTPSASDQITPGVALSGGTASEPTADVIPAMALAPQSPRPYRVNSEFYHSPEAAAGALPTVSPKSGPAGSQSGSSRNLLTIGAAGQSTAAAQTGSVAAIDASAGSGPASMAGSAGAAGAAGSGTAPGDAAVGSSSGAEGDLGGRDATGVNAGASGNAASVSDESEGISSRSGSWLGWLGWSRGAESPDGGGSLEQPAAGANAGGREVSASGTAAAKGGVQAGDGSAEGSPRLMETPRVAVSSGTKAEVPLTPEQGEPVNRRLASNTTTTSNASSQNSPRRNSGESAEATSEGGWPSSSSGGWPSSSSSVDVQAYRAAYRERVVGGSPVRDGQSGVPWDVPGSGSIGTFMQPILEGAPNSMDAAAPDAGRAQAAGPNASVTADAAVASAASRAEGAGTWPQVATTRPATSGLLLRSLNASPAAAEAVAAGSAAAAGASAAAVAAGCRAEGGSRVSGAVREAATAGPAAGPNGPDVTGSLVQPAGARSTGELGPGKAALSGGLHQGSDVERTLQSGGGQPKGTDRASRAGDQAGGQFAEMHGKAAALLGSGSPLENTSAAVQSKVGDSGRSILAQPGMSLQAADTSAYSGSKQGGGFNHEPSFSQLSGQPSAAEGSTVSNFVRPAEGTSGGTGAQGLAAPEFSFLAKGNRDLQPLSAPVTSIGGRSGAKRSGKRKAAAASGAVPGAVVPGPHAPDQDAVQLDDTSMVPAIGDASTEEEDTSPRSRAMSAFLARRKAAAGDSTAVTALAAVRAARAPSRRPSLPAQVPPLAEAGALIPRAATDVSLPERSPPRLRRKASPRELAEAFKGHGLRQADWAPVPIYWARSVESRAPVRDEQNSTAVADQVMPALTQPIKELTMSRSEAAAAHGDDASKEPSPAKGPETPGKRRVTSAA
ncbi:g10024 [Coccomyxa elongata]